jgi:hypothetical protein
MKKLNAMLHNEKIQGNLVIGSIFVIVAVIMVLTWGK